MLNLLFKESFKVDEDDQTLDNQNDVQDIVEAPIEFAIQKQIEFEGYEVSALETINSLSDNKEEWIKASDVLKIVSNIDKKLSKLCGESAFGGSFIDIVACETYEEVKRLDQQLKTDEEIKENYVSSAKY